MSRLVAILGRVLADHDLRRLEAAFSAFGAAEYGVWVAVLVYAYQRGGATLAGVIAVAMLTGTVLVSPLGGPAGRALGQDDIAGVQPASAGGVLAALRGDRGVSVLLGLIGVQFIAIGALDVLEVVLAVNVLGIGP